MTCRGVLAWAKVNGKVDSSSSSATPIGTAVTVPGARLSESSPATAPSTPMLGSSPTPTPNPMPTSGGASTESPRSTPKSAPMDGEIEALIPTSGAMATEMPSETSTAQPTR